MVTISEITKEMAKEIIDTRKPLGAFWLKDGDSFVAIDNTTGDAWTEDFTEYESCIKFLKSFGVSYTDVTDIQQARAIIKAVGEPYQHEVVQKLRGLTYYFSENKIEREAQRVIDNMEHEYALNVANTLWKDKFEDIPEHIKKYS